MSMTHRITLILPALCILVGRATPFLHQGRESWARQLQLAQQAALQIDPKAVLIRGSINAWRTPGTADTYASRLVTLDFIRPSGDLIQIQFDDTAVQRTIMVDRSTTPDPSPSEQEFDLLHRGVTTLQIDPLDILQRALPDGRAFHAKGKGFLVLTSGMRVQNALGVPMAWMVDFTDASNPDPNHRDLNVWIDPQTGAILGRTTDPTIIPTVPPNTAAPAVP